VPLPADEGPSEASIIVTRFRSCNMATVRAGMLINQGPGNREDNRRILNLSAHAQGARFKISGTSPPVFCRNLVNHSAKKEVMKQMQTRMKSESALYKPHRGGINREKMSNKFAAHFPENCSPTFLRVSSIEMITKLLRIGVIGLLLCAGSAWAGPASIQGIAKDTNGRPLKGADVRIESRDGKHLFGTVKTDAKGRYVSKDLKPGVYRVSLIVNGAVKASIMNTKTVADRTTRLNFELKSAAPSRASTKGGKGGRHMVWVPANTGSHIGGRWVEVEDGNAATAGALNVQRGSAEALRQQQLNAAPGGLPGVSAGTGGN